MIGEKFATIVTSILIGTSCSLESGHLFGGHDIHFFFCWTYRYLTRGTRLMVHERKLNKTLNIDGPLTTCVTTVKASLKEIQASMARSFRLRLRARRRKQKILLQACDLRFFRDPGRAGFVIFIAGRAF